MARYRVVFRPRAAADLFDLYSHIANKSGLKVAGAYVARIEAACLALETFPERGTRRGHILPGLRTMGFERRATILFQVLETEVAIIRVLHGGRDYLRVLRSDSDQ